MSVRNLAISSFSTINLTYPSEQERLTKLKCASVRHGASERNTTLNANCNLLWQQTTDSEAAMEKSKAALIVSERPVELKETTGTIRVQTARLILE